MIRQRGRVWQVVVYGGRDEQGKKRWLTGSVPTRREALTLEARLKVAAADRKVAPRRHETVRSLLDQWIAHNAGWSPTTLYGYRRVAAQINTAIGDVRLRDLTTATLDRFYARLLATGMSALTVRNFHAVIRRACNQAVRWGQLPSNPALIATPPRVIRHEVVAPRNEQVLAVLNAAQVLDPALHASLYLATTTGARRGEICGLQWSDLIMEEDSAELTIRRNVVEAGGHLTIKAPKTHASRRIMLDSTTTRVIRAHRQRALEAAIAVGVHLHATGFVFSEVPDGSQPWRPGTFSARFRSAVRHSGTPPFRLHDLRHFAASTLVAAGVDPRTVAGRLGHADATTTLRIYAHFSAAADNAAAGIVARMLSSSE